MRGEVAGVRVWPAVVMVWFMWVTAAVVSFAVAGLLVRWHFESTVWGVAGGVAVAFGVCAWIRDMEWIPPYDSDLADRYELARHPHQWWRHAQLAERMALKRPEQAEQALRQALDAGSGDAWKPLVRLLERQGREGELAGIRAELVRTASVPQLQTLAERNEGETDFRDALLARGGRLPPKKKSGGGNDYSADRGSDSSWLYTATITTSSGYYDGGSSSSSDSGGGGGSC